MSLRCPARPGRLQRATRQARMDIEGDVWADGEQDAFAEIAALSGAPTLRLGCVLRLAPRMPERASARPRRRSG